MKNSQHRNRTGRKPALSSIGLAVVATLIAGGVHAADTSYGSGAGAGVVNSGQGLALLQDNAAAVYAEGNNSAVGQTYEANTPTSGGNSGLVDGNTVGARAIGNDFDNSIGLALINSHPDDAVQSGSAILSRSNNSGYISTLVSGNTLSIWDDGTDSAPSSRAITNNTISADSFGNRGVSLIAGPVPNSFTSDIDGSSSVLSAGLNAAGGIVVTSSQATTGDALASAESNTINLRLTSTDITAINAEDSGAVLSGNTIAATARGNRAASAISIESGGAPSFTGSAVVTNVQSGSAANATADNRDSTINALVDSTGTGINTLQGALAVNNNTISSAATGNDALGSSTAAGNRIVLADGMSFAGAGAAAPGSSLTGGAFNSTADLVIQNVQFTTGSAIASTTDNAQIRATVDAIDGGGIDLSGNRISASATGSGNTSALDNGANVASFVGSVALASNQGNGSVDVTAINSNARMILESDSDVNGDVNAATLSVAGNSSTAAARGNQTSQSLVLNANTLPLGTTAASLVGTATTVTANGAATVSNRQANAATTVSASLTDSWSDLQADDVAGSTLTNTGNLHEARALGNSASNAMALAGTTVGTGAGIVSVQTGDASSSVTALVDGADADLLTGDVTGSTLSLTDNAARAVGYGNSASNALSVAANDFAASSAAAVLSGDASTGVLATGAAAVSNLQTQAAAVDASNLNARNYLDVDYVYGTSTLSVTGNSQEAMALRNSASNTLNITGTTVGAGAGIVSVQRGDLGSTVTASVENASAKLAILDIRNISDGESATLSVSNNTQRAVGYGNSASNALMVNANDFASGSSAATLSGAATSVAANGTAVVSNLQTQAASVAADNLNSNIELYSDDDFFSSTLAVARNTQDAQALGNSASNALTIGGMTADTGAGSVGAGAGIVSVQRGATGSSVAATLSNASAMIESDDDIWDATLSVTNNAQRAVGYGNLATNALRVNANDFAAGSSAAALSVNASSVNATGAATVSNLQDQSALVSADNTNSRININAGYYLEDSTLSLEGNTQEAMAQGSRASNALTLKGTTVGAGAGIVNAQRGDSDALVTATLTGAEAEIYSYDIVVNSTLSVSNNLQRAIGYGNSASNALEVNANTIRVDRTTATPSVVSATDSAVAPSVLASYGILNTQSTLADVTAWTKTNQYEGSSRIETWSVYDSSVLNQGNALVAAAYGNESSSRLDLLGASSISAGSAIDGFAPVANITSTQAVNASISATADGQAAASTAINGWLEDSTVSTSGNSVNAQAIGNLADNLLNVAQAGNINTAVLAATGTSADAADLRTNASFSVQNVQSGEGMVTAMHQDNALSTEVRVDIRSVVDNSSVFADRNSATASATSNSAFNTLGLEAGSLASSSAVQNVQTTSADVNAFIGSAATAGTIGQSYTGAGTGTGNGTGVGITGGSGVSTLSLANTDSATFNISSVTDLAERAVLQGFLENVGFVFAGTSGTLTNSSGFARTYNLNFFDNVTYNTGNATFAFTGYSTPSVPGTAARGGVMLAVGSNVIDSTLSVAGNVTNGSAAGNRAVNTSVLTGNDVASGSNLLSAAVTQGGTIASASADHTLTNLQTATGNTIASEVAGAFAIDAQPGANISGATLRVSGNSQSATARGNTATNALELDGNSLTSVLALQSTQVGGTAVDARSTLDMFAPADVTHSSVTLSDNVNTARAVLNNASNSLLVSGTNVGNGRSGSIDEAPAYMNVDFLMPAVTSISAEQVLANRQTATGAVSSTAVTNLYNQGQYTNGAASLVDSTLTLTGNTTQAVALANQALNIATVSGGKQAASVALSNSQDSIEMVEAMATTTTNVVLRGDGLVNGAVALNNSSVLLGGNNTTALAAGNYADNALNSLASNAYGAASGGTVDLSGGLSVNANAGILNRQSNLGAVSAESTNATYMVALNSGVSNSSVSLAGNRVAAEAYGNSATNRMTLNALNTGSSTAAVANYQRNDGSITAAANGVTYGVGITGATAVAGSTVRTTGNQITATAVGNSAVSSILAR